MSKKRVGRAAAVAARVGFKRNVFVFLGAVAALTIAAPAAAAVTVTEYTFSSTTVGQPGPAGTFQITFDDALNAFALTAFNSQVGVTNFTTANTGLTVVPNDPNIIFVGGNLGLLSSGTVDTVRTLATVNGKPLDDFYFAIFATGELAASIQYRRASEPSTFYGGITTITKIKETVTGVKAAVPEPATWAMMLVGFGGIGFAMRRKRSCSNLGGQYA